METLSVVIPAYNEEQTLAGVVRELQPALDSLGAAYEIVIVDDGSTDSTARVARELPAEHVRLVQHETNRGAGAALATGIAAARQALVLFVPADGQFDPAEIAAFTIAAADADIVVGCRNQRPGYGLVRRLQSRTYLALVNALFGTRFRDVNWVQLWRRETAGTLPLTSRGVFMQTEMLLRARHAGLRIVEIPSAFRPRTAGLAKGSRPATVWRTLREMASFARRGCSA